MLSIDKISAKEIQKFNDDYFALDKPVIITDVLNNDQLSNYTFEYLEKYINNNPITEHLFWYESNQNYFNSLVKIPDLVSACLKQDSVSTREKNVRLWTNKKGNYTSLHYDGNLLFIFNLQLVGKKKWLVIPPDQKLQCYPFIRVCKVAYNKNLDERINKYVFELNQGEMLYLPPLYAHAVLAEEDSININWIATRHKYRADFKKLPVYQREQEMHAFFYSLTKIPILRNALIKFFTLNTHDTDFIKNYGGSAEFSMMLAQSPERLSIIKRFFVELKGYYYLLRDATEIKKRFGVTPRGQLK